MTAHAFHHAPAGAALVSAIRAEARPLTGAPGDHDELIDRIGDARVVLLGEATHGTHELYRERAAITKRLIEEKGFTAIAVEGDWPDAQRVNRWIHGADDDPDAERALAGFERFPAWMWRNADVLDFVGWLRAHNDRVRTTATGAPTAAPARPVGFYGLDLYSLYRSIEAVIAYLAEVAPADADRARDRYGCFERFDESQVYGYPIAKGLSNSCREGVLQRLLELRAAGDSHLRHDGIAAEDERFYAEENARLVIDAEEYYRSMFTRPVSSWNLRDSHMAGTLERLVEHLDRRGRARTVVWAHNSHVGDARRTAMGGRGEHNIGQIARERFGLAAVLVGFTTYEGTVTAASEWGGAAERRQLRPAVEASYEALLHRADVPAFWLPLRDGGQAAAGLREPRLERAIGVIYRPETEIASHYCEARLSEQFDALVHVDRGRAVEPLAPPPARPPTFRRTGAR